ELKNFPTYGNGLAVATQHDLLIHIQSLSAMTNIALMQNVLSAFGDSITVCSEEHGYRLHEARGFEGFVDGTENPHDLADIQRIGVIDNTQPDAGGSYVLLQKYQHNLSQWQSYSLAQQEESVGRSKIDNIEFSREERHIRSHLSRTNLKENSGSLKIVRRSLPYGKAEGECGLMFCAYCHTLYNLEKQLQTMFGDADGQTDFLIERLSKTLSGAYYFAPSVERLRNLSQAG
ncbi:MAG: Dyp-type peroxidase, partial [Neisseriaceae bacterium]|nr:Dyp-type peroxidase [Neisseriaceae bacterium]